jgi:hypothetical protein
MKTLKILVILCFMFRFGPESTMAQALQKTSYKALNRITSKSIGNLDTTFRRGNTSGLYQLTGLVPDWITITSKISFTFITTNGNNYDVINDPVLSNCTRLKLAEESAYMAGSVRNTFNGKWERLTGKPIFDTTSVYYSPLKRTNSPTWSDNHFYRLTGNIFNMIIDAKYPSLNAPK